MLKHKLRAGQLAGAATVATRRREPHAPRHPGSRRHTDGMNFSAGNQWPISVGGQGTDMK
jgi:hypothetical protein